MATRLLQTPTGRRCARSRFGRARRARIAAAHDLSPDRAWPAAPVLIGLICLVAGPFAGTTEWFAHHLHSTFGFESLGHFEHHFDWATAILGTLAALGGLALCYVLYGKEEVSIAIPQRLRPLYEASLNKFYVDEFYEWFIVRPTRAFAVVCDFVDAYFVDALVEGHRQDPARAGSGGSGQVSERADPVLRGGLGACVLRCSCWFS